MTHISRPSRSAGGRAVFAICAAWILLCPIANPVPARADVFDLTRAFFPDRLPMPKTSADAGEVGAGRAVLQTSSRVVNPAVLTQLPDTAGIQVRLYGALIDPRREDLGANTGSFTETSPFFALGENGIAVVFGDWAVNAGIDLLAYQEGEEVFLDDEDESQAPVRRTNTSKSSLGRGSFAIARGFGKFGIAAAIEFYRAQEKYTSTPSEQGQMFGEVPFSFEADGSTVGGGLGVIYSAKPFLSFGGSAHFAGGMDLEDPDGQVIGTDEVPLTVDLGGHLGRQTGGNVMLNASYVAERTVTLPDSVLTTGKATSPARWTFSGAYGYYPKQGIWDFRAGFAWSPYPKEGGARATTFGTSLGFDLNDLRIRGGVEFEKRVDGAGLETSRRVFMLGLDIRL